MKNQMIGQADFCRLIQRIVYPEARRGALNFSQCDCSNIYGAFGWIVVVLTVSLAQCGFGAVCNAVRDS